MNFDNPIIFFFCSLGVFNGFLVSLYFLFFNKTKRLQNYLFGFLVLMLSLRIGKSVYIIFNESRNLLYVQIGLMACFLIGVFLYYYLKSSVENTKTIPRFWKIHIGILAIFIAFVGIIAPYGTNTSFWNPYFVKFIYAVWGIYIVASGFVIKHLFKKIFSKKEKCTTPESWLVGVFIGNVLIYAAYIIGYFLLYLVGTLTFSFVFYLLLFFLLMKKNRSTVFQDIPEKYASHKIEEREAKALIEKLTFLMKDKGLYKNADIRLKIISSELNVSTHKLSQLLNDNLGKSFASFVNEYRIEEAKKLLKSNDQYTLEGIGYDAGFSSKSSFYAIFKKQTGQTPAEFKKRYS